jgi:hypothetical protein
VKTKALYISLSILLNAPIFGATWYVVPVISRDDPDNYRYSIQEGINAASDGDTILVEAFHWILAQTIVVTNNLTIRSLHGPQQTIVDGNNAGVCFNLGGTATTIDGFTITRGLAGNVGGISCQDYGPALVVNSIVVSNSAIGTGGMRGGTARNCLFYDNVSTDGSGGMAYGTAINCTFIRNTSRRGGYGGMSHGTAYNSIFFGNLQVFDAQASSLYFSCAPDVTPGVNGNIAEPPLFVDADANDFRVLPNSPCIDAGSNDYAAGAYDLIGNPRIFNGTVDMGAYEFADGDGDGLRNEDETNVHGTDPVNPDTDGDGFDDAFEVSVGINPLVPDEDFVAYIQQHSQRFNLYPSNAVLDVAVGQFLLGATNGTVSLRLQFQQTTNLETWTPIGDPLEWNANAPGSVQFFRLRSAAD